MSDQAPTGRSGRRGGRKREATASSAASLAPYIIRNVPTYELQNEETLELLERNADTILEEIGIEFRDYPRALELFKEAGASIDGERVRFPKGMCRKIIMDNAPSEYTNHARNADRTVKIGGKNTVLVPAYGSPFVRDLDGGRRYGEIKDFQNFVKLAYMSPSLHFSGGTICEPVDVPVPKRHLDMLYSHIKYSDKPFMASVTAASRAQDTVDMLKILYGDDYLDPLTGEPKTFTSSLINANSPMVFDDTMLGAGEVLARNNQATVISPFILAGAMSPVTIMGTCAQILAEVLAGAAFIQLVKPGAPVVFGTFASSISMQSGAPTFGTPEPSLVLYTCAQLARRLKLPFRSGGGLCASKLPDAQAAYEATNTLQTAMLGGVNFMLHTAGWLEGGLVMSYEKFMMDADQAGMMQTFMGGTDTSENGQALDALKEVGPGQHFLGCAHTQANFKNAFYRSNIADNNSFEQWESEGSLDAAQRANVLWKKTLQQYDDVAPSLDEGIDDGLKDFVSRRKSELPDSAY
jgi:trimethylamine--corrinoid protein Co-methyltransferase